MRSPTDFEGTSRLVYHSSFFEDDILSTDSIKEDKNKIFSVIKTCFTFLCSKKRKIASEEVARQDLTHSFYSDVKKKFSFTEAELRKIAPRATDASVQTGNSLEMAYIKKLKDSNFDKQRSHHDQNRKFSDHDNNKLYPTQQSLNELNTLRRIRDVSASLQSTSRSAIFGALRDKNEDCVPAEEVELHSTEYDRLSKLASSTREALIKTSCEIHPEPPEQRGNTLKHLRFEEGATTIPSTFEQRDDEAKVERRGVVLGMDGFANIDLDSIEENEEPASSTGRDFMRFWGGGKVKKTKKKAQVSLRNN